jgi:formimidoylglutamate deiminase
MTSIFARKALTIDGWAENVRIVTSAGRIDRVDVDSNASDGDVDVGIVIPGLANAHSHAFQRVLAGHTEHRGPREQDNFWSWRSRMYALAERVDADALRAIATQLYTEMVATGYTAVAEFHYLHSEPGGPAPSEAMFEALARAAADSGIRLTYVPVLYERAGFGQAAATPEQQRFTLTIDAFIEHYERVRAHEHALARTGIGVHSLRAVSPTSLAIVADVAARDAVPMHIHIAEQQKEVEDCIDALGARPVEWLLANNDVDEHWCLVHATHIDDDELDAIARAGAIVCLCPSTEANLGDGLFPLQAFLKREGRIAIGSDSHVSVNPFEELRWLEYGQRLSTRQRNIAAVRHAETGRSLFEAALAGGAGACGTGTGQLEEGANADLVVLDDDSPMLVGHSTRSLLDALVFSGFSLPIDRVMVGGEWLVEEGRHRNESAAGEAYAQVAKSLQLDEVAS